MRTIKEGYSRPMEQLLSDEIQRVMSLGGYRGVDIVVPHGAGMIGRVPLKGAVAIGLGKNDIITFKTRLDSSVSIWLAKVKKWDTNGSGLAVYYNDIAFLFYYA